MSEDNILETWAKRIEAIEEEIFGSAQRYEAKFKVGDPVESTYFSPSPSFFPHPTFFNTS